MLRCWLCQARLGLPLELADAFLGILFFVLLIERTGAVAMHLTGSREASLYAALVTALTGHMVFDALNGLETTLFMFLTMACFGSLLKSCNPGGSRGWQALWLYLTALTRPEGYWFAVSLLLYLVVLVASQREKFRHLAALGGYTGRRHPAGSRNAVAAARLLHTSHRSCQGLFL